MPFSQTVANFLDQQFPGSQIRMHDPGGDRAMGTIISSDFQGLYEEARLQLVWGHLRTHFGAQATRIGVLLLFTPGEEASLKKSN